MYAAGPVDRLRIGGAPVTAISLGGEKEAAFAWFLADGRKNQRNVPLLAAAVHAHVVHKHGLWELRIRVWRAGPVSTDC